FKHFGKEEQVKSIESTIKRTLFFDYGTISFQNKGWLLKIHIYSTTGQDFYVVTRPVTLRAIDGIIFVIDTQKAAWKRNLISWKELESYFREEFIDIPKVLAFNKQDLPDKFNPNDFLREIDFKKYNNTEIRYTIAISGEEILASFEDVLKLIFKELYQSKLVNTPSL
ncbi:MAG: ADP-ribosylation factor-like protein, partial [Promethearchaeia archaeon]